MDTTEVQLTTDGVENFSYARNGEDEEEGEVPAKHCGVLTAAMFMLYWRMKENCVTFG